jgi:hypothetical protein
MLQELGVVFDPLGQKIGQTGERRVVKVIDDSEGSGVAGDELRGIERVSGQHCRPMYFATLALLFRLVKPP